MAGHRQLLGVEHDCELVAGQWPVGEDVDEAERVSHGTDPCGTTHLVRWPVT